MNLKRSYEKRIFKIVNALLKPVVKRSTDDPFQVVFDDFLAATKQQSGASMLEIGSRNVTGEAYRELFPHIESYTGFDVLAGEGVDVVGDAHKLSDYFENESFDFVYSVSVLEHILFPWKVAIEMNKVMKTGGYVFLSTHTAWPEHEMPWDFWRFPANGFHALFNQYTGFELVMAKEGLPGKMFTLVDAPNTSEMWRFTLSQAVSVLARKTGDYRDDLIKWDVDISGVVDTMYPEKNAPE